VSNGGHGLLVLHVFGSKHGEGSFMGVISSWLSTAFPRRVEYFCPLDWDLSIGSLGIEFAPQTDGLSAQYKYLTVYSLIILISIAATMLR
jgi:hypothetical protein